MLVLEAAHEVLVKAVERRGAVRLCHICDCEYCVYVFVHCLCVHL